MGGRHLDQKTKEYIASLYYEEGRIKPLTAREVIERLQNENDKGGDYVVPDSDRTIHYFLNKLRDKETEEIKRGRKPWSIVLNEEYEIDFDDTLLLLRLLRIWFQWRMERKECPPHVPFSVDIAKWAIRINKAAPFLSDEEVLKKAKNYYKKERFAKLNEGTPDSSFEDLEIAMQDEKDPKVLEFWEEFRPTPVVLEGEIGEDGITHIPVSPDILELKNTGRKRKKQRGK